ncbi:MAG: hypothetical protein GY759_09690, partial [Chloroflexi bacterium]|nr:hypothetical protein [Chloroflexota bacterium]
LDTHTATVDWDDGLGPVAAVVDGADGSGTATGMHSYLSDGGYTVQVCVTDNGGAAGCDTLTVTVQNAPPTANDDTYTSDEDMTLVVGPPGALDNDTDPGDDILTAEQLSVPNHGTLTTSLQPDGSFVYEPAPNWHGSDSFTYQTFDGIDTSNVATVTLHVLTVDDPIDVVVGDDQTVDEGAEMGVQATFYDPDSSETHTASVDWGDGVSDTGFVSELDGSGLVTATHTYLDDAGGNNTFTITLCVNDPGTSIPGGCDTQLVTVNNLPPTVDAGPDQIVNEGDSLTVTAIYTDSGILDTHTATVDWDDGLGPVAAVVDGADGSGTATGMHSYLSDGDYTVQVCVTDNGGATGCDTLTITIQNAPPAAIDDTYSGDEDSPLVVDPPGVLDNDPGGDTLTSQLVNGPSNGTLTTPLQADGSFVYKPFLNWNGSDYFTYQAFDGIDASIVATVTLHVLPVDDPIKVVAGKDTSINEGEEAAVSANFTDPDSSEAHTATIDWGDGATDSGVVAEGGGSGTVSGSHVYADDGTFIVIVCVNDPGTNTPDGCDTLDVTVSNLPPTADAGPDQSPNKGDMAIVSTSFSDPGILDTHTATVDWDDGLGPVAVVLNEANGAGTAKGNHSYLSAGDYIVQACVMDNGGAEGCDSILISVQPFDSDGDGLSNGEERELGTDPFNPDSDEDGLDDGEEVSGVDPWAPTDPLNPDSDGDEIPDGEEVANGTDPNDPDDPPASILLYEPMVLVHHLH